MEENVKRALEYLQKAISEATQGFIFREETPQEKLRLRCLLAKELKKVGLEVPPDNITIR